jgi:hypothetical protein
MDAHAAAERWAAALRDTWARNDIDAFAELYADGTLFRGPLSPPEPAVEHMRVAFTTGAPEPDVWVGQPVVQGDRAAVEWWGVLVVDGEPHTFAGTAWLRFDEEGRVVEENDYWQSAARRVEPWADWGR